MSPPLSVYNKRNTPPLSSKSLESFNSSGSCCPKGYSNLQMYKKSNRVIGQSSSNKAVSEVRQRVTSARLNRLRTVQNQLSDAHGHIGELLTENRLLRTIHKRQDSALTRYEGTNAELPQLLNSHAEEVRVWQIRCRNLQSQNRELIVKLKQKDTVLLTLTDHNRHLSQLNVDKNLEERDKLSERVRQLETQITEKDEELKVMHRRIQLEANRFKKEISSGIGKQKELTTKLEKANAEIIRIGDMIRTESMMSPSKLSLGSYLRANKLNNSMATKIIGIQKKDDLYDRIANGGGDSRKKDTSANEIKSIKKSSPPSSVSSKTVTRNYSQQSSEAFPLMKSYMADKSNRSKPFGLSNKIKHSMMDFTDIKYPKAITSKPLLNNSSSMESSDTIHSASVQYDDDGFETSSTTITQGTNENNNQSDAQESDDFTPIGDFNFEKHPTYSDQRNANESAELFAFKRNEDVNRNEIDKIQKEIHADLVASESFMDSICESVTKEVKVSTEKARIPVRSSIKGREVVVKKGRVTSSSIRKKTLDPVKKTELLAVLRAEDGTDD